MIKNKKNFVIGIIIMVLLFSNVYALVVLPKGNPNIYTDISGHWAEDAIRYVISEGYFKGETSTTFEPELATSRAMICTVLWRLTGDELTHTVIKEDGTKRVIPNYVKMFWDMKDDDWYTNYISWANDKKIVNGYSKREFRPEENVSREQLAVIIDNYYKNYRRIRSYDPYQVNEETVFIDDNQIADWAKDAVYKMQKIGLLNGREDGSFDPQGIVTRAELATIIHRMVTTIR